MKGPKQHNFCVLTSNQWLTGLRRRSRHFVSGRAHIATARTRLRGCAMGSRGVWRCARVRAAVAAAAVAHRPPEVLGTLREARGDVETARTCFRDDSGCAMGSSGHGGAPHSHAVAARRLDRSHLNEQSHRPHTSHTRTPLLASSKCYLLMCPW